MQDSERAYAEWIAANVPALPVGMCAAMTERMAIAFPELTRTRGHFQPCGETREYPHWWLVDGDGTVIDPTAAQFNGPGDYVPHEGPEPTGRCIECGGYCFTGQPVCGATCARAFGVHNHVEVR